MRESLRQNAKLWFKTGVAGGLVLALVSVGVAVATYRFVSGHLALDHLTREAGRYAAVLEYRAQEEVETPAELAELVNSLVLKNPNTIAWVRVLERSGEIIAETGKDRRNVFDQKDLQQVLDLRRRNVVKRLSTPGGEVLAAVLPFRFRFGILVPGRAPEPSAGRELHFKLVEVALYLGGAAEAFAPLKRNLAAGIAAPLALLVAMVFLVLRFPAYLRGQELEHQLALARRVQQELLPAVESPGSGELEVTAEFQPFWGVGGDYFDVFSIADSRTFVVLGDVSGKGLAAALIMGLLHGAVRSTAWAWDGSNHDVLAGELNQLLYTNTASNRFVTFFWACLEPLEGRLRFINAGHNPPLLVRRRPGAAPKIEELPAGGPVLGLLPQAAYQKGDTSLNAGDLLVLFSDGVVEAANSKGVEFGQEGVEKVIRDHADLPPDELKQVILSQLATFMGPEAFQDDMTLLIVRVPPSQAVR